MKKSTNERLRVANKWASLRAKLIKHVDKLQVKIANLTPVRMIADMLRSGRVTSTWFVQRLVDSGYSLHDAVDELHKVRHAPGGENVSPLPDGALPVVQSPYFKPIHAMRKPVYDRATLNTPAPVVPENCISCNGASSNAG